MTFLGEREINLTLSSQAMSTVKTKPIKLAEFRFMKKLLLITGLLCFAGLQGCEEEPTSSHPASEIIEDVTGRIRLKADMDSSLYVIVPDFNPDTVFALTGPYLPSDNLPEEFKVNGLRVFFGGEVVDVPPDISLPAKPLKLSCILKTGFFIFRNGRGTIKEIFDPRSVVYVIITDFDRSALFLSPELPGYLPPDNLPDEFKVNGLKVLFSGEIVPLPPSVDLFYGIPLKLSSISKL